MFSSFTKRVSSVVSSFGLAVTTPILLSSIVCVAEKEKEEQKEKENEMNTIIFGSGEYVTGYTGSGAAKSDKSMGIVGLVMFDLRRRGLIGKNIAICGTNGNKFDAIRKHWDNTIKKEFYNTFCDDNCLSFTQFPKHGIIDCKAYKTALYEFSKPGDICIIFTPDDTHFEIVSEAIDHGLHVLCTKPFVKTLKEHLYLVEKAKKKGVLLQIEVHKRYDPMYNDAINRIQDPKMGEFNYFISYMSQPKLQLITFKSWAGISSDISYYLNSHHIDLHVWSMQNRAKCIKVNAFASNGIVANKLFNDNRLCEDTISICSLWQDIKNKSAIGHAIYTSSWSAISSDVHSQQRFFCLMENGEINIDQAHRGYTMAVDSDNNDNNNNNGLKNINPLFIRNKPDKNGNYCSQNCYGYITFEKFVKAAKQINNGDKLPSDFDIELPTGNVTRMVTGILQAGKISLDNNNKSVLLEYDENDELIGLKLDDNSS